MPSRLGLRGRLLLAFIGISAFSVFAAVAALYSFFEVGDALERITQERVPATVASQKLSRQAERLAAAAPSLLAATSPEEHEENSGALFADLSELNALLKDLEQRQIASASFYLIDSLVERLGINLTTLDSMIINSLVLVEHRKELLSQLRFTDLAARRTLAPGLLVMDAKLAELRRALTEAEQGGGEPLKSVDELAPSLTQLAPLQDMQAEVSALNDMLVEAAAANSEADLGVLQFPFRRSLERLDGLLVTIDPDLRGRFAPRLAQFRGLIGGPESIPEARRRELRHRALMHDLLDQNVEISRQLTVAVDLMVFRANRDIQNAKLEALSVQHTGTVIMVAVVVLSLGCSVLIVWLYVGRNVIARLTGLGKSMQAIAGGNLDNPLPAAGPDEIGEMAKALAIFRDTAVEVRDTNLREIREARRRLMDAIESISEGFALFDRDDRLVLCNSRYRQGIYPGPAEVLVPGTPFETIVRAAAGGGRIVSAKERGEAWVRERLRSHSHPDGPLLQQQSDGRWIQINERRTEDGGTVGVYADITDVKVHEQALENLSNQLSKYLSPQVYDSIFSGKQEVKLASSRKKLTVFFSDIAGFTEAAERLESEELTQLLNQYLTEMTEIALRHGATVDKYMGDGMLIFFGAPDSRGTRRDALACVRMAIAMRERLHVMADSWRRSGIEQPLRVRMGIHTGYCTVGNFGSEDRLDYTIIGRGVNTAARLETAAPAGEILISYETFAQVSDVIHCVEHDQVEVKGIAHPLTTYRVVDSRDNLRALSRRFSESHPRVSVDLDIAAMTTEDRREAGEVLRRALAALDRGAPAVPGGKSSDEESAPPTDVPARRNRS